MSLKVIDGKLYNVVEASLEDLKIEVNQVLAVITEQSNKIAHFNQEKQNVENQFNTQILNYQNQISAIQTAIANLEQKKTEALSVYPTYIDEAQSKIDKAKLGLIDKQDAIKDLLPEDATKLGF